ncbi:Bardet-Biedl syndrome 7 protein homolog isoform X2 [Ischnura elegans]|uniref:Bardet-Biedl syndrome 7 protein homolog isoform X2 n=1 Tax=Ischnura elegans TaxID=197161 RepID=UPI001ED87993|nr:Bardet-Biedl syndrome 7 protein homolog isoform X2 [Ischnura elegans]
MVAVADHEGVLQVFSVKKDGIQHVFKTPPGPKITSLDIGGHEGSSKDKIFVAMNNEVHGFTRRGKPFFDINTNLTEPIRCMKVHGKHLYVCGKYICNHYESSLDVGYTVYEDEIVDLTCVKFKKSRQVIPITASKDGTISVIKDNNVRQKVDISVQPTVLHVPPHSADESSYLFFGTSDGRIGRMNLLRYVQMFGDSGSDTGNNSLFEWVLKDVGKQRKDGILCLDTYDLTGDGVPDLLVGCQDGTIEVFSMEEGEEFNRRFSYACNESVTSIQGGMVGSTETSEIVAATVSGWVFGLTSDVGKQENLDQDAQHSGFSREARQKIFHLRSEIADLEQKVTREREKYLASTEDEIGGLSAIPYIHVNHDMTMNKGNSSYILTLETQVPLDSVLLQSNVPLDLQDVEKNSAVVSYSKCDPASDNHLLASYRCQVNARKLLVEIYTKEGLAGTLQAYVTPQLQPKCCRVLQFPIRPLSLHTRCQSVDDSRSQNTLLLMGAFSMAEIHSWIQGCLPDIPEKLPTEREANYFFQSTFIDTQLQCKYSKGKAEFKSDNITTISILRDYISKEATKKNMTLEIICDINENSANELLERINPMLTACLSLKRKLLMIDALHEILDHNPESNMDMLETEYKELLQEENEIRNEMNNYPFLLKRIHGMITDLFIDVHKFKGVNVKGKIQQLMEVLDEYSLDKLKNYFNQVQG